MSPFVGLSGTPISPIHTGAMSLASRYAQFRSIDSTKLGYGRRLYGTKLPQPDHGKTCTEYTTRSGTSSTTGSALAPEQSFAEPMPSTKISQSGLICSRRLPARCAALRHMLQFMVPHTPRGSLRRSQPMTRGLSAKRRMTVSRWRIHCSAVWRTAQKGPSMSLLQAALHRSLPVYQPAWVMWSLTTTASPASVHAVATAAYTSSARRPCRSGLAASRAAGISGLRSTSSSEYGSRTALKPSRRISAAMAARGRTSSPPGTNSSSEPPYQFTAASLRRAPVASRM